MPKPKPQPPEPYTHNFEYSIGDGGKFIKGLIEFNKDGRVSYKMESWSEPLLSEDLANFTKLIDLLKDVFHGADGLKKIVFEEL